VACAAAGGIQLVDGDQPQRLATQRAVERRATLADRREGEWLAPLVAGMRPGHLDSPMDKDPSRTTFSMLLTCITTGPRDYRCCAPEEIRTPNLLIRSSIETIPDGDG
jgi:hypothetical protein